MDIDKFEEKLNEYINEMNIVFQKEKIKKLYIYMELLIEWNEKINLTAITNPEEIILKHFIDSLTISKEIPKGASLVDVGTGAGFPGIPIKILREDINVTLVDSLNKRIKFLDEVIEQLNLTDISAVHARAEEFGKMDKYREKFDVATSRAVANLSTLSEYLITLLTENGIAIFMKGSDIKEELEDAINPIKILGGKIEKVEDFNLPLSDIKRCIIISKKINKTPEKYPRKPGIPAKGPLK
mgnify:CR=1 FL=1